MRNQEYIDIVQRCFGESSLLKLINSSITPSFENILSKKYDECDQLRLEVAKLKEKHTDEMLDLKLKLSNLIDTNYNLLQQLTKDSKC